MTEDSGPILLEDKAGNFYAQIHAHTIGTTGLD